MALEQDIQDLTRNIDDLNDSFVALNRTLAQNLQKLGVAVQKETKAITDATKATDEFRKSVRDSATQSADEAKRKARRQIDEDRYHRSYIGRLEQAAGANVDAQKSIIRMTNFVNGANQVLGIMGKTVMAFGKAMYQGEQGASANNSAIEAATSGIKGFLDNFGIFGKIVGSLISLFSDWLQETNKLSDRLFTAYSEIARVGVAAGDGMRGAADAAVRLGFGLSDPGIQNFIKLMKGAASDLALLSGSALEGRRQFVAIAEQLIDRGPVQRGLMNLGYSVEDINQNIAAFIQNQVGLGVASSRTNRELVRGSIDFIKNLDVMAKLTGQQAQDLQQQIDANRRNERFRAAIEKVRLEEGDAAAQNLELNMAALARVAPETAKGLMDISAGFVNTKEAAQAFQSGLSGIPDAMKRQLGGGFQELGVAVKNTTNVFGVSLGQVGAFGDVFGSLYEQFKLGNMSQQDYNRALAEAIRQQQLQEKGADGLVGAQTNMRIAQMDTRDSLQQLGVVTASVTTPALAGLAQAASSATRAITGGARTAVGGAGGALAGAGAGFLMGGPIGALIGGIGGGLLGGTVGAMTGGAPAGPGRASSALKFGGGTGSQANFDKLNPEFRSRIEAMAAEYQSLTGQALQINSAFRSAEEQAALIARGGQGSNPIAAPGQSRHQSGLAIDVQPGQRAQLESLGLLRKYGMTGIPGDPPHIQSLQFGGIASGPRSGYTALLHGNEAVIPLTDGRSLPVEMPGLTRGLEDQMSVLGAQLTALEDIARVMRDNNAISTRILQVSQN